LLGLRAGSLPGVKFASARPTRRRAARASAVAVPAADKDDHADLDLPKAPADAVVIGVEVVDEDETEPRALAADAPAKLDAKEREQATLVLWAPDYDGGNKQIACHYFSPVPANHTSIKLVVLAPDSWGSDAV